MLEELNSFFTSSTIHGLSYIPSSRRLLKLFWLSVVLAGFICSTSLIQKSFRGWEESPISTSVDILPITEITFPNVTVCPPKRTFTALNYDLALAENMTIRPEDRVKLVELVQETTSEDWREFYVDLFQDHSLETILLTLTRLIHQQREEENTLKQPVEMGEDLEKTWKIFGEVLEMFQLKSLQANLMMLTETEINREE